jgi:zinc protease
MVVVAVLCALALAWPVGAQTRDLQGDVIGWPSSNPPPPLPAHDVPFPPYEVRTFPNGLQVVVVQQHEEPAVSMRLIVRAGSAQDPAGKTGLANLAASLLDQGTTTKSAEQIADAVDSIGGNIDTGSGIDLTYAGVLVMKDSFDFAMNLLSDLVRHPAFAQTEVDRQKSQLLAGLRVSRDDPSYIADAVFNRLVYGSHPYGQPQEGTPDTISRLTHDDFQAFHDEYFVPNNSILAIVGDVMPADAFAAAERVFGGWERHDVPTTTYAKPPDPESRVIIVNKPDAVQTEIRVGNIGTARKVDDYMALNLAIRVLGGEGSDRLQQVLRTERGLTYGAQADLDSYQLTGDIEAQTNTRSAATAEVLRLMVNEFWRLQQEPVGRGELRAAKDYMIGSFPLTIETPEQIALQVLNALFYQLPLEQLQTFRQRVEAVTPEDIQRVARSYLKPGDLSVVLVGNASAFIDDLKSAGFAHYDVINLPDLDLASPDLKRASSPGAPPRTPAHSTAPFGEAQGAPSAHRGTLARRRSLHSVSGRAVRALGPAVQPVAFRAAAYSPVGAAPRGRPQDEGAAHRVTPTPEEQNRGQAVVAQAVSAKAKGGLAALKNIHTVVANATTTVMTPRGPMPTKTKTTIEYPDRFCVEATLPEGTVVQVYDAGRAWMKGPQGVRDASPPMTQSFRESVQHDIIHLLVGAASGTLLARGLPDVKDADGRLQHAVELSSDAMGPVTLYVDARSGAITRETYASADEPGSTLTAETFSDYRSVDGIQVAFRAAVRHGSVTLVERTVTSINWNAPVDEALFKRPAGESRIEN